MTIERDQDDRFYSSEMSELKQPYTPIGITDETLDETIIINKNRQENADHHNYIEILRKGLWKVIRQMNVLILEQLNRWQSKV